MSPIRIGIIGYGKIARDQHEPAIAATPGIELVAVASRSGAGPKDLPRFETLGAMLAGVELDAVALCMPPQARHGAATEALLAGKHVFLEKPPGATLAEVDDLAATARHAGTTLFASWHSRFAAAVEPMRAHLSGREATHAAIAWKEDVRRWHPGQDWIWEAGGLGVFDPGINALSIATAVLPRAFFLRSARLAFPQNRQTPIAADLAFTDDAGLAFQAAFDWGHSGADIWSMAVETADGSRVDLSDGGKRLTIDGASVVDAGDVEYCGLYARFVELVSAGQSDVDRTPLTHVADAFTIGRRETVEAFHE